MDLAIELPSDPDAPARAREAVGAWAAVLPPETLVDLNLVITELVANSVVHGRGTPIHLRLTINPDGVLRGEVADDGDGSVMKRELSHEGGGLGLHIVDRITDDWGVYEASTHVWFETSITLPD